jgi:hypothetical protein
MQASEFLALLYYIVFFSRTHLNRNYSAILATLQINNVICTVARIAE